MSLVFVVVIESFLDYVYDFREGDNIVREVGDFRYEGVGRVLGVIVCGFSDFDFSF